MGYNWLNRYGTRTWIPDDAAAWYDTFMREVKDKYGCHEKKREQNKKQEKNEENKNK